MNYQIKIHGDGNCLFRCFSYFLYNSQNFHTRVRHSIIQNVIENWENYKLHIIGNEYYVKVINSNDYFELMSKNTIYGTEVEIQSFAEMYDVETKIYINNSNIIYSFGNNLSDLKLSLLFSGNCDSGHYDIINYNNNNIESQIIKIKNKNNYLKRKSITNAMDNLNITIKKQKIVQNNQDTNNIINKELMKNAIQKQKKVQNLNNTSNLETNNKNNNNLDKNMITKKNLYTT